MTKLEQLQQIRQEVAAIAEKIEFEISAELSGQQTPTLNDVAQKPRQSAYHEFCKKHGGEHLLVNVGDNRRSFPDGAIIEGDATFYRLFDPPRDARENNHARRDYALALLVRAERDFSLLKTALIGGVDEHGSPVRFKWPVQDYGAPPKDLDEYGQPCGEAALQRLKKIVEDRRAKLAAIEAEPVAVQEREAAETVRNWQLDSDNRRSARRGRIKDIEI